MNHANEKGSQFAADARAAARCFRRYHAERERRCG